MTNPRKASGIALAAAGLLLTASPGSAQTSEPVRIGVMDLHAKEIVTARDRTKVVYREFTPEGYTPARSATPAGPDHGQIVASAMIDQFRRLDSKTPIEIYSANAFGMKQKDDGTVSMRFDFDQGIKALEWMNQNGVRVVVTAFNSKNEAGSRRLMDKAQSLGMIVFAGAPNTAGAGKVYPAADPRAISVVDSGPDMALRKDPTIAAWVHFAMDGTIVTGSGSERSREIGSSYASAKAGGYGAYIASRMPMITAEGMIEVMQRATVEQKYRSAGQEVMVREIDASRNGSALASAVQTALSDPMQPRLADALQTRTKGPGFASVDITSIAKVNSSGR